MKCVKLAVADGDPKSLKRYVDGLSARRNINIVASTADGAELIQTLSQVQADVVLTDLALKRIDGFGVLEAIGTMPGTHPKSLVFSEMNRRFVIDLATRLGADYYLIKPINCDLLYRRICQLAENGREEEPEEDVSEEERNVARLLCAMGIPASRRGYQCLMVAATLCARDRRYAQNLSGRLYPEVARQLRITVSAVEHAIRMAIHGAWKEGGLLRFAAETGERSFAAHAPTAGQIVKYLAEKNRA